MIRAYLLNRTGFIASAFGYTSCVLTLGYLAFGFWTMMIFTSGFLGGFFLWILFPKGSTYAAIRIPYFVTFGLFLVHRIEERQTKFFAALAKITDVETPSILSWQVIALVAASVGGWLLVPALMKRNAPFGDYLAWTFFTAMGVTELAHFILPWFEQKPYGYFPGMASVVVLAPSAWWGMVRLAKASRDADPAAPNASYDDGRR